MRSRTYLREDILGWYEGSQMGRRAEVSISLQLHSFGHFSSLLARYSFQWREATLSFTWELVKPSLRWGRLMGGRERAGMVWVYGGRVGWRWMRRKGIRETLMRVRISNQMWEWEIGWEEGVEDGLVGCVDGDGVAVLQNSSCAEGEEGCCEELPVSVHVPSPRVYLQGDLGGWTLEVEVNSTGEAEKDMVTVP